MYELNIKYFLWMRLDGDGHVTDEEIPLQLQLAAIKNLPLITIAINDVHIVRLFSLLQGKPENNVVNYQIITPTAGRIEIINQLIN